MFLGPRFLLKFVYRNPTAWRGQKQFTLMAGKSGFIARLEKMNNAWLMKKGIRAGVMADLIACKI